MSDPTSIHELKTLMRSLHPIIAIETIEEERARALLLSVATQLALPLWEWSVTRGLTKAEEPQAMNRLTATPLSVLQHLAGLRVKAMFLLKDFSRYLTDAAVARQFRELPPHLNEVGSTLLLSGESVELPREVEDVAVRYRLRFPDRNELNEVITHVLRSLGKSALRDVELGADDREALLRALGGLTLNQARQAVAHAMLEDGKLTARAIQSVLKRKAQAIREGGLLEYYPVGDNRYQLGGFANLKAWLARARLGFAPEARALNLSAPRGILMVGVPGCGKSLSAKVIAREWQLPLLKLDAGRLYDKYVGESERNFRKAISLAESMAPVVLWIDEIEKGLVAAGSGDADAGLSRRLFGAFLTWLQEKRDEVFVVATANDLSILPPELLRKGRFDEIFFVDLPDPAERESIFKIHLGLHKQDPARFDLAPVVAASEGFSGAEIEQAVVGALYRALLVKRPLETALLVEEVRQTVPLSASRREDIERLREMASGRFVSVR